MWEPGRAGGGQKDPGSGVWGLGWGHTRKESLDVGGAEDLP